MDMFRGLRDIPTGVEPLRHHLSAVHHTLHALYFVDPETAHFVLQPEKSEDFMLSYSQEVEKIFQHISKITRRKIKVRVHPRRYRGGFEIVGASSSLRNVEEDPVWTEQMRALGRKLQEAELLASSRLQTPEAQKGGLSAARVLDSSDKRNVDTNSLIFSTPPEFKGFTTSTEFSGYSSPSGNSPAPARVEA